MPHLTYCSDGAFFLNKIPLFYLRLSDSVERCAAAAAP